jgi:DNA replication protein DnaC
VPCPECAPAVQARRLQAKLDRSGVGQMPAYTTDWSWETLQALPGVDAAAVSAAAAFSSAVTSGRAAEKRGLYLYGRIGRGKTSLAICILKDAQAAGLSVGYVPLVAYFRALRNAYGHGDSRLADEYERLRAEVDVLVLDDLGVERPTGFVLEELYALIEDRSGRDGKWTIITSNYDREGLVDLWVESRLATDADRVTVARICQRIRRHFVMCEVLGENLCPAGDTAAGDDLGDDLGDAGEGGGESEADDER